MDASVMQVRIFVAPGAKVVAFMMHDMGDWSVRHGAMATESMKSPQT
jgi:hypothetical protein